MWVNAAMGFSAAMPLLTAAGMFNSVDNTIERLQRIAENHASLVADRPDVRDVTCLLVMAQGRVVDGLEQYLREQGPRVLTGVAPNRWRELHSRAVDNTEVRHVLNRIANAYEGELGVRHPIQMAVIGDTSHLPPGDIAAALKPQFPAGGIVTFLSPPRMADRYILLDTGYQIFYVNDEAPRATNVRTLTPSAVRRNPAQSLKDLAAMDLIGDRLFPLSFPNETNIMFDDVSRLGVLTMLGVHSELMEALPPESFKVWRDKVDILFDSGTGHEHVLQQQIQPRVLLTQQRDRPLFEEDKAMASLAIHLSPRGEYWVRLQFHPTGNILSATFHSLRGERMRVGRPSVHLHHSKVTRRLDAIRDGIDADLESRIRAELVSSVNPPSEEEIYDWVVQASQAALTVAGHYFDFLFSHPGLVQNESDKYEALAAFEKGFEQAQHGPTFDDYQWAFRQYLLRSGFLRT